jgi:hypothetical protein
MVCRNDGQMEIASTYDRLPRHHKATPGEKLVTGASSLGTVLEWYDFANDVCDSGCRCHV